VADITAELAKRGISLNAFVQKESGDRDSVPCVITTYEAAGGAVKEAFEAIRGLSKVEESAVLIRIIDEHAESL
jgi:hypothetical protein